MTQPNSVRPSTLHQGIIAYVGSEIDTIYTSEIANTYPIEHSDESNTSAGIIASILNSIKIKWQSGSKRQTLEKISDEDGFKAKKLAEKFVKDLDEIPRIADIESITRNSYPNNVDLGGNYFKYHGDIHIERASSGNIQLSGEDGDVEFVSQANPENFTSGSYQTVADTGGKTYEMTGVCYPKKWEPNENSKYPVKFVILWAP